MSCRVERYDHPMIVVRDLRTGEHHEFKVGYDGRWCAVRAGSIRARRGEPPSRFWIATAARLDASTHRLVMPGLVPGIHA